MHKNPWRLYQEIFLQECYRPLMPLGSSPRILDVGANIGLASLYFLWRWPAARLRAWEPNPAAFQLLCRNVTAAGFPEAQIRVEQAALSTTAGTVEFNVPSNDPAAVYASIREDTGRITETPGTVRVQSFDARAALAEPADLVKLDIEGHEYEVLDHALPTPSTARALMIEFHRVEHHWERFSSQVSRLVGEGGYWMTDGTGAHLQLQDLKGRRGSLLLRFFSNHR